MTAGELLAVVRRRHGLTQTQLAARARTSQAAISRIERDLVSPSVAMLASLLDLMGEELRLSAERVEYGHDRELLQENLTLSPAERIAQGAYLSRLVAGRASQPHPPQSTTLHMELARILESHGNVWMTTRELARAVNEGGYRRPTGGPVTAYQVHGRTKNYPAVFERRGSRVRITKSTDSAARPID